MVLYKSATGVYAEKRFSSTLEQVKLNGSEILAL